MIKGWFCARSFCNANVCHPSHLSHLSHPSHNLAFIITLICFIIIISNNNNMINMINMINIHIHFHPYPSISTSISKSHMYTFFCSHGFYAQLIPHVCSTSSAPTFSAAHLLLTYVWTARTSVSLKMSWKPKNTMLDQFSIVFPLKWPFGGYTPFSDTSTS